jgi:ribosomal protein S18 acetylase RimI-like enzyme
LTTMNLTIRPARLQDIPSLSDLLAQLFSIESGFTPDREKQARGLSLLLTNPPGSSLILVATSEETVIGMATVQTLVSTAEGGLVGLVEDVIVDSRFRCRNVGTLLLEEIQAWSRYKGLLRLQLLADRDNHQALNFYSSRGWDPTGLICLRKKC